ncbi:MAG: hypothetical protein ACRDIY_03570, partial [Chloroflexota bacterium]
ARSVAAALAFQPDRPIEENLRAIDRALAALRSARVVASDATASPNHGKMVAWLDDSSCFDGDDLTGVTLGALSRLGASEREIITLYHGRGVSVREREALIARVTGEFPGQHVESVVGGQARDLICLSCE